MRILMVGGGPAGLYFALLMKQRDPRHAIRIVEHMAEDMGLDPVAFARRLMTRNGRIDREKLRTRDPEFVASCESET